jgi:Domain of unknown function (DU1801)
MAELKTRRTRASVPAFLGGIANEERRRDCRRMVQLMKRATGAEPKMWGTSIVGFGSHPYRYASGREGFWFQTGFSPRKSDLTLYFMAGLAGHRALLGRLGKHKTGKCCLYIKKLSDVDLAVLRELIEKSVKQLARSRT